MTIDNAQQGSHGAGGTWHRRPGASVRVPLTVTDVRQYFYCPRIVFYRLCQPLKRPVTYKMLEWKLAQDRTADLEHRRSLASYGLADGERRFDVDLTSERLGLRGKLDMLIVRDHEAIPVEFKNTTRRPARNHGYQLAAYALLISEHMRQDVRRGFLYLIPQAEAVEVTITAAMKANVVRALEAMRVMVACEAQPDPTAHYERCVECEYRRFCGDVD